MKDEKKGQRYADQLVKVQLKNGKEKQFLVHVEIQSSSEKDFSERMFQYFYGIYDRHKEKIVVLAVHISRENIFSRVVLAAKAFQETKEKVEQRYQFKRKLMRNLLRNKKYTKTAVAATIYFIDYLLKLPAEETEKLDHELGPEIREEQRLMELYDEENAPPTVFKIISGAV